VGRREKVAGFCGDSNLGFKVMVIWEWEEGLRVIKGGRGG